MRHLLGHQRLFADRRVRRAAAHREIVADDDNRAAVDKGPAHHAIRRHEFEKPALRVIFGTAGNRADLVKAAAIDKAVNALADRELTRIVLTLNLVSAAKPPRKFL